MAYKKVVLTERDNSITQNDIDENQVNQTQSELKSFDTDYTDKKLQNLYTEFDSISLDENQLDNQTISKMNAQSSSKAGVSAKTLTLIVSGFVLCALILFLAIYNIFVINNMGKDIKLLQGDVTEQQYLLNESITTNENLTNQEIIENELQTSYGYTGSEVNSAEVKTIAKVIKQEINKESKSSNWFDAFCNFLSRLFGR